MLKGNKGEWSEVYVFFKLLADGVLFGADGNLNKREDVFYNILDIIRKEKLGEFHFKIRDGNIDVEDKNENILASIKQMEALNEAKILLAKIVDNKGTTFSSEASEKFLNQLHCTSIKAPSGDKSDIVIQVNDFNTGLQPQLGFSIKSRLGQPSTLLNAGRTTNFIYEINGKFSQNDIEIVNNMYKISSGKKHVALTQRMNYLIDDEISLNYLKMENNTFQNNLMLIDSDLPNLLAYMLIYQYKYNTKNLFEIIGLLAENNPLHYDLSTGHKFYEYKVKKLLLESALGMRPNTVWNGRLDVIGGYIIVREDGEVLCYHLYNRNDFEDYLLKNTYLEQASTSRYDFGSVYKEDGKYMIKLNLQIRFFNKL